MKNNIKGFKTMKKFIAPLTVIALTMTSCEIDKSINDNPNDITLSDVDARLFLNGAMLANFTAQVSHLNRIAGMYSGQVVGYTSLSVSYTHLTLPTILLV